MVKRIGHMALQVQDLDEAVAFFTGVLALQETLREPGRSYLTCNERHHELILIEGPRRGYDHIGLEVADAEALEETVASSVTAGGKSLGPAAPEPGIAGAALVASPAGHRFKLFYGMETVEPPPPDPSAARPSRFEHVALKARGLGSTERFLEEGLGFKFSDRVGSIASWWHCDEDHHGLALQVAPNNHLHHHAWKQDDVNALAVTADRLYDHGGKLAWGIGHHGPGDNRFIYFKGPTGAMVECCSDMASFGPGSTYEPRNWPFNATNLWGAGAPLKFVLAGAPLAAS